MTDDTDDLRDIFLAVSEDGTVTEHQVETASKTPVDDRDAAVAEQAAASALDEGLDDAVGGFESRPATG